VRQRSLQLTGFLRAQDALRELAAGELAWLAGTLRFRRVAAGESIYLQDGAEPDGDALFVLADGAVVLEGRAASGEAVPVATLRAGALFGGLPLLGSVPHAESARAQRDCLLLALQRDAFGYVKALRPRLARGLSRAAMRAYTERLQQLLGRVRYHS
jgi:CRP-like cAMP-binding protein